MVILEGMLHGLAVAAADVGGPSEILSHEQTGLLFAPRDVTALSHAIVRLAVDPTLRRQLAATASAHVREHWLWPEVLDRIRRVYAAPLARARGRLATSIPVGDPWSGRRGRGGLVAERSRGVGRP